MMPMLLNYCSPEAAFTLEEFAGTPLVPLGIHMKKLDAFDYWPDECRELARAGAVQLISLAITDLIAIVLVICRL